MISNLDALPQVLFCGFDDFSWCTSKITEHVLREACLNSFIASMELGPCFLKEKHPQFVTVGLREGSLLLEAGNVVIDNDLFPLTNNQITIETVILHSLPNNLEIVLFDDLAN